ncbi:response regulator transcription factor [Streptomyces sp. NPDC001070]
MADRDLVRLGYDDRWYPMPPQSGLLPLVDRAQEQLVHIRELVDRLGVEYQRVHEGHRAEEMVRFVEGAAAVRACITEVHATARSEVMAFSRTVPGLDGAADPLSTPGGRPSRGDGSPGRESAPAADILDHAGQRAMAPHNDGSPARLRRRVVIERAGLEALGAYRPLTDAVPRPAMAGATYFRVAERLPVRLCIADRSVALLPLAADGAPPDPVLLVIRPSSLLEALVTLFDAVWSAAVPLAGSAAHQPRSDFDLRILALLVTGSTDAAMARALGVAVRTVQRHIAAMQRDAGVDNRVQLVWYAARHGWLDDGYDSDPA